MRKLTWQEYNEKFESWAESTRYQYVNDIVDFTHAEHGDVAEVINCIYNQSAASKLANKAMDAGIRFDSQDMYLIEDAIDEETRKRAKKLQNTYAERYAQKKKNREAFWNGVGTVMFIDDTIDAIFGKKKK